MLKSMYAFDVMDDIPSAIKAHAAIGRPPWRPSAGKRRLSKVHRRQQPDALLQAARRSAAALSAIPLKTR
jgi:hypothetical protein